MAPRSGDEPKHDFPAGIGQPATRALVAAGYTTAIRAARQDDLAILPGIERAAAAVFRATPYAYLADDDLVSAEVDLAQEYVWVAVDPDDQPIAFAIVHVLSESVHLHE